MPLSYCSIAWAIQPTVRPMINSPRPALLRQPQPDRRRCQGKIDIGVTPDQAQPGFGSLLRQRVDFGCGLRENRQDSGRARVTLGIERLAKARQPLAARQPAGHHRHRIVALQELAEQAFGARGLAAVAVAG